MTSQHTDALSKAIAAAKAVREAQQAEAKRIAAERDAAANPPRTAQS